MADGVIEIIIGSGEGGGTGSGGGGAARKKEKASNPHEAFANKLDSFMHPIRTGQAELMKNLKQNLKPENVAKASAAIFVIKDIASQIWRYGNMELNRHFSLRENYLAQNKINMFHQQMDSIKGVASSIGSSVAMGAIAGGPVGAAAGLIYGAAKTAIDVTVKKEQKMEQYNMQLNATNAQTQFSASRAALVNGGRGTEY